MARLSMEMAAHCNAIDLEQQVHVHDLQEGKKQDTQEPCPSLVKGEIYHDAFGELPANFSARQVDIISLGSNTGSAIFIGIGKGLANAGPLGLVVAYIVVCTGVWANVQNLAEMTIAFPGSSNYINYISRWVDPSLAFGAGLAEWLGWTSVFAAEASFFLILVKFWAGDAVPDAALLSIFLVACLVIFLMPTVYFAWLQYIGSLIKILLFLFLLAISLAIIGGAGSKGYVHHGEFWRQSPVFKNGFAGFSNAALLACWAVGDQVFVGVLGSEAQSPRYSMARAANMVPFRMGFMYLASAVLVGLLVPATDDRLLSGTGTATSPYIIAIEGAGIKGVSHLVNACIIAGVMAMALESIYLPSRILRTMALENLLPKTLGKADPEGRPRWALIITAVAATILTYISLSNSGAEALNWFISITSASFFVNWACIALAVWQFRAAVEAQNLPILSTGPFPWKSKWWPLCPLWAGAISVFLLVCCLAAAIQPVDGSGFTVYNFFSYMIGLIIIVVGGIAHKLVYRTRWQDAATADCVSGRRELSSDEIQILEAYYSRSVLGRFGSYFKVW